MQAIAQQHLGKGKNAPMFSNVNGGQTTTSTFSGGTTMAQVRKAAEQTGQNGEHSQQLYMQNYPCEVRSCSTLIG